MIIVVGSENPVKIAAVEAVFQPYGESSVVKHVFRSVPAKSGVREQPLSLDETIMGACQRARDALVLDREADLVVGLESGVFTQGTDNYPSQMFDVCACAIMRRRIPDCHSEPYVGLSSAWVVPRAVANLLIDDKIDMDEAFFRAGLTKEKKLGRSEGAVGLLSKGRLTRQAYTQQAIEAALIAMNHEEANAEKRR